MSDRLDLIADDLDYVEEHNILTDYQRKVLHDFEMLMIAAELDNKAALFNIFRYRMACYLQNEGLKFRGLSKNYIKK